MVCTSFIVIICMCSGFPMFLAMRSHECIRHNTRGPLRKLRLMRAKVSRHATRHIKGQVACAQPMCHAMKCCASVQIQRVQSMLIVILQCLEPCMEVLPSIAASTTCKLALGVLVRHSQFQRFLTTGKYGCCRG